MIMKNEDVLFYLQNKKQILMDSIIVFYVIGNNDISEHFNKKDLHYVSEGSRL